MIVVRRALMSSVFLILTYEIDCWHDVGMKRSQSAVSSAPRRRVLQPVVWNSDRKNRSEGMTLTASSTPKHQHRHHRVKTSSPCGSLGSCGRDNEDSPHRRPTSVAGGTGSTMVVPPRFTCFVLPVIDFQNNTAGHALRHMSFCNPHVYSAPRIRSRPPTESAEICRAIYMFREQSKITSIKLHCIEKFRQELEYHLMSSLPQLSHRTIRLEIYGSTMNGFGTRDCDVDMSLSFLPDPPEWVNGSADTVMRHVAKILVDYPDTLDERFISCRVPIVRFRGKHMNIEADISYDNRLALHNTSLLSHYCSWEAKRLPTLGIWIKTWAKRCGIGDASKGSLSSYAWIIMLIMYLQNCGTPPFLKRLQQEGYNKSLEQLESGWNVYFWKFYDPNSNLHEDSNVYDLFVGFLDFFINFFRNRRNEVIQIRDKVVRTRTERWLKYSLCIEDPFELDHNLAQSIDEEMLAYILLCMDNTKKVFLDRSRREDFLKTRGILEATSLDDRLIEEYGNYLLHSCVLEHQPPVRTFRDRTFSQMIHHHSESETSSSGPFKDSNSES